MCKLIAGRREHDIVKEYRKKLWGICAKLGYTYSFGRSFVTDLSNIIVYDKDMNDKYEYNNKNERIALRAAYQDLKQKYNLIHCDSCGIMLPKNKTFEAMDENYNKTGLHLCADCKF